MSKIKSFEDACVALKLDPNTCLPDVSNSPKEDQKAITAYSKLIIIARALNDGWIPNWDDSNEYKYYPWFYMQKDKVSGLGLSFGAVDYVISYSFVGSRLCYRTRDLAEHAGKQFIELYADCYSLHEKKIPVVNADGPKFESERARIAFEYCVSQGWPTDHNELSLDQISKIRSLSNWQEAGK